MELQRLQNALDSRLVLEQAKGVLAHRGDLDMPAAYAALRQSPETTTSSLRSLQTPS